MFETEQRGLHYRLLLSTRGRSEVREKHVKTLRHRETDIDADTKRKKCLTLQKLRVSKNRFSLSRRYPNITCSWNKNFSSLEGPDAAALSFSFSLVTASAVSEPSTGAVEAMAESCPLSAPSFPALSSALSEMLSRPLEKAGMWYSCCIRLFI
jgi:hypothetical protein